MSETTEKFSLVKLKKQKVYTEQDSKINKTQLELIINLVINHPNKPPFMGCILTVWLVKH